MASEQKLLCKSLLGKVQLRVHHTDSHQCTAEMRLPICFECWKIDMQDASPAPAALQALLSIMSSVYIPSMQADMTWPDTTKREFTGRHPIPPAHDQRQISPSYRPSMHP